MEDNYVDKIKQGDVFYPIVDTVSGYLSEEDHGEIAEGDTGYVTGDDIFEAMGEIESQLAEI